MTDCQLKVDTIEECVQVVESYLAAYPEDIFPNLPKGKHGKTVDGCAANALRAVLPHIIKDLRALKR